jgi:hypothetical protein
MNNNQDSQHQNSQNQQVNQNHLASQLPPLPQYQHVHHEHHTYKKSGGCLGMGCSCRTISCGGCFIIVLVIIIFTFLVVNRTPFFWSPFVDFMNAGVEVPEIDNLTADEAKENINVQIKTVGENLVHIDESELTALVKARIPDLPNPVVDIEPEYFRIYFELDKTIEDKPLYGMIEVKHDGTKVYFSQFGTGRVAFPEFLNEAVTTFILARVSNVQNVDKNYAILYNFLAPDSSVTLSKLDLDKDELEITISVAADLFR